LATIRRSFPHSAYFSPFVPAAHVWLHVSQVKRLDLFQKLPLSWKLLPGSVEATELQWALIYPILPVLSAVQVRSTVRSTYTCSVFSLLFPHLHLPIGEHAIFSPTYPPLIPSTADDLSPLVPARNSVSCIHRSHFELPCSTLRNPSLDSPRSIQPDLVCARVCVTRTDPLSTCAAQLGWPAGGPQLPQAPHTTEPDAHLQGAIRGVKFVSPTVEQLGFRPTGCRAPTPPPRSLGYTHTYI
jgi:hypothetical protein